MPKQNDAILYSEVEQTADLLIAQLLKIKEKVKEMRSATQSVNQDAEQPALSDAEVAALLNKRHRTITKRFPK